MILCKGADSVMIPRLAPTSSKRAGGCRSPKAAAAAAAATATAFEGIAGSVTGGGVAGGSSDAVGLVVGHVVREGDGLDPPGEGGLAAATVAATMCEGSAGDGNGGGGGEAVDGKWMEECWDTSSEVG